MSARNPRHPVKPHQPGVKLDGGKVRAAVILDDFALALKAICKVGQFGISKYVESGWLTVPDAIRRYSDARDRHRLDRAGGEHLDPESGYPHEWHEVWCSIAVLELKQREELKHAKLQVRITMPEYAFVSNPKAHVGGTVHGRGPLDRRKRLRRKKFAGKLGRKDGPKVSSK